MDTLDLLRTTYSRITSSLIDLRWKYQSKSGSLIYAKKYSDVPLYARGGAKNVTRKQNTLKIYTPDDARAISQYLNPDDYAHQHKVSTIAKRLYGPCNNKAIDIKVIETVALLHDVLKNEGAHKHGKQSAQFLKTFKLFDNKEVNAVASALVAHHSGDDIPDLSGFTASQKKRIHAMLPIIRIADVLSRSESESFPISFSKSGKMKLNSLEGHNLNKHREKRLKKSVDYYNKYNF